MADAVQSPNIVFASGAVLQPDGTITRVVEANAPRQTTDPAPAEPAAGGDSDERDETASPVPAEAAAPDESGTSEDAEASVPEPSPAEAAAAMGQRPGESNRSFRRRLWEENQQYQARHPELLQRIAYLEGQLAAQGQRPVEPQAPAPAAPGAAPALPGLRPRPQVAQYADYAQYEDDLRLYWKELDAAETAERERQSAAQRAQERWTQRLEEGRLKYRDFDQRVRVLDEKALAAGLIPLVVEAVMGSEYGADLHYLLATDPQARAEFNRLEPWAAVKWLHEAERRLARPQDGPRPPASRSNGSAPPAPAPLNPVGTGPAQPVVGFRSGMSLHEYEVMRDKERGGRR